MAILQSETSLTTDQYNALMAATADINRQIIAYRHNADFDSYLGRIARDLMPFSVAADDDLIVRVINDEGDVYGEYISNGTPVWSTPTLVSSDGQTGVQPKVVSDGAGEWDVYVLETDGQIHLFHSADGDTWDAGTAFSSVVLDPDAITWLSYAGGAIPLAYVVETTAEGAFNVVAIDATARYDTGIYWSSAISGFDAINFTANEDDTSGAYDDTDLRHNLVITGLLPNYYTFKTSGGQPIKQAQPTGGTISFIVRPPNDSRPIQVSRWYPVQTVDQWYDFITDRTSIKLSSTSSVFASANDHDTLWACVYGHEGDYNGSDTSYSYQVVVYYSSRDGKHWTQEHIIPLDTTLGLSPGDFAEGAALIVHDDYVWLLSSNAVVRSLGCVEFNNPHASLELDVTSYVIEYSSGVSEARQSSLVLDNADGALLTSFLGSPGVFALITKFGLDTDLVQVSIEEVDSITPHRERPNEYIQVQTRDRLSWLTDRVESANAIQWDNQLASLDTFSDQNGVADSGLAHSDVVKGSFTTKLGDGLSLRSKFKEGIDFHAVGGGHIADGHAGTIFTIPKPEDFGGTNEADSPTYAGVVFRAQDKDNLWAVWYNYWSGDIELIERKNGISTIQYSYTPTLFFSSRARTNNTVGIRAEFKSGKIFVYESVALYSNIGARYSLSFSFVASPSASLSLQGYIGVIGCGYSDQDEGETEETPPILTDLSLSGMDLYNLNDGIGDIGLICSDGYLYRTGTWQNASPTWGRVSLGVSGTVIGGFGDPYSPKFLNSGDDVNIWVVTTTGIYRVTTVNGTPSATLQKTLRATSSLRSIQATFGAQYVLACISTYGDGTYITYSTDGINWSAETLFGDATGSTVMPGAAVSSRLPNRVYGSAISSGVGKGFRSTASGASLALYSPILTGTKLAGDIHVPFNDNPSDSLIYYGSRGSSLLYDFIASNAGWALASGNGQAPTVDGGQYTLGVGWEATVPGASPTGVYIQITYGVAINFYGYILTYSDNLGGGTNRMGWDVWVYNGSWNHIEAGDLPCGIDMVYDHSNFTAISNVTKIAVNAWNTPSGFYPVIQSIAVNDGNSGLIKANGSLRTNVGPIADYSPWQSRQIDSDGTRRNLMVVSAGNADNSLSGIWKSSDGGGSWQVLVAPAAAGGRYERSAISSDGKAARYVFGTSGVIGLSNNSGPVASKMGNIASFSPGTIVNVIGL